MGERVEGEEEERGVRDGQVGCGMLTRKANLLETCYPKGRVEGRGMEGVR